MIPLVRLLHTKEGIIFGAKIYPEGDSGHIYILKQAPGVIRSVVVNVWQATNGSRGRIFNSLEIEEQEEAFTVLLLRAMTAPMDENLLFSPIENTWL